MDNNRTLIGKEKEDQMRIQGNFNDNTFTDIKNNVERSRSSSPQQSRYNRYFNERQGDDARKNVNKEQQGIGEGVNEQRKNNIAVIVQNGANQRKDRHYHERNRYQSSWKNQNAGQQHHFNFYKPIGSGLSTHTQHFFGSPQVAEENGLCQIGRDHLSSRQTSAFYNRTVKQLIIERRCFYCQIKGHLMRNCKNKMKEVKVV